MYVAKQLDKLKLEMQFIRKSLIIGQSFTYKFPIKTKEELIELNEKIKYDTCFASEVVSIQFLFIFNFFLTLLLCFLDQISRKILSC